MRAILAIFLFVFWAQFADAQTRIDSEQADQTFLTIYPDNLAMVTEVRRVTVPAGLSTIRFLGVSDQIISQTAVLQSFEGVSLESNFDSDLITKGALLNKAVGQNLRIRRINPASGDVTMETVTLVSASNVNSQIQGAVFETRDGLEALDCAGLWEGLIFSGMPKDLNPMPVLSMDVRADFAGEKEISLSYLTQGIGWAADYRLDVNAPKGEGALSGWLTITNNTAKSFQDVPTAIIAGELNREGRTRAQPTQQKKFAPFCWTQGSTKDGTPAGLTLYSYMSGLKLPQGNSSPQLMMAAPVASYAYSDFGDEIIVTGSKRQATQEEFGDYKLYRTPQPVTVAAQQTKQIAFIDVPNAEYERVYKYNFSPWNNDNSPQSMRVEYEIDNDKDGNLGKPLPRGTMRVMTQRKNGKTAYLGENFVRDLAVDLPVEINVSQSAAVMTVQSIETINRDGVLSLKFSADVFNASPESIMAEIKFNMNELRYDDITKATQPQKPDTIIPTYRFPIAAESSDSLSIEFPINQRAVYDHNYARYIVYQGGEDSFKDSAGASQFNIGSQSGGNVQWISRIVNANVLGALSIKGSMKSKDKIQDENGEILTIVSEDIVFKNNEKFPVQILFRLPKYLELSSANIDPDNADHLEWILTIPSKGQTTLSITTQGHHEL